MAIQLQGTTPNLQGSGNSLQGNTTNIQGSTPTLTAHASMGIQTPSPKVSTGAAPPITSNVTDLSSQYASVPGANGAPATIYNKSSGQAYSTPQQFFAASGQNSFNNLKFDTAWTPPTSTLAGLQMPGDNIQSSPGATLPPAGSTGGGSLGSTPQTSTVNQPVSTQTSGVSPTNSQGLVTSQNPSDTTSAYPNAYTGTQSAQPDLATLSNQATQLSTPSQQEIDLANQIAEYQNTLAQAETGTATVGDLEGATGRQTAINESAQATLQSLQGQLTNLQNQRQDALTGINNQIKTLTPVAVGGAGGGTALLNPSSGAVVGQTSGLTQNLVGAPTAVNPSTGLIGAGATGGGLLGTPQSSASGGVAGAVSSVLTSLGANDPASNAFITSAVQQALANGGNVPTNLTSQQAQVVQQVLSQMTGGQYSSTGSNINLGVQTNQATQLAGYQSALQQAQALQGQLNTLISTKGINPQNLTFANGAIQAIANYSSNPDYQTFSNLLNDISARYAQILTPPGGSATDSTRSVAQGMINGLASGQSITQVMQSLDQQAQNVISGVTTTPPANTGLPSSPNNGLQMPSGYSASIPDGALTITTP